MAAQVCIKVHTDYTLISINLRIKLNKVQIVQSRYQLPTDENLQNNLSETRFSLARLSKGHPRLLISSAPNSAQAVQLGVWDTQLSGWLM